MSDPFKIALLGVGNMGGAMLRGWICEGVSGERITVIDPNPNAESKSFMAANKITHLSNLEKSLNADLLILAVKPQIMMAVLEGIKSHIGDGVVLASVAAGISFAGLKQYFPNNPLIRVMPNTPAQVGQGASVCVANSLVNNGQKILLENLLSAIGMVKWVEDEALIDAVTGVSGSGPAYVFNMVEALAAAGCDAGLDEGLAEALAKQTIIGAAELLKQSDLAPSELRKNVTSPNGTTAAALEVLMGDEGLLPVMRRAVDAATKRSRELAKL